MVENRLAHLLTTILAGHIEALVDSSKNFNVDPGIMAGGFCIVYNIILDSKEFMLKYKTKEKQEELRELLVYATQIYEQIKELENKK